MVKTKQSKHENRNINVETATMTFVYSGRPTGQKDAVKSRELVSSCVACVVFYGTRCFCVQSHLQRLRLNYEDFHKDAPVVPNLTHMQT